MLPVVSVLLSIIFRGSVTALTREKKQAPPAEFDWGKWFVVAVMGLLIYWLVKSKG